MGSAKKVVIRCFKNQPIPQVWTPKQLLSEHYPKSDKIKMLLKILNFPKILF
jgi:hypothetical protein